jgi:O-antigen/teichoic acid export membrane protein
MSRSGAYAKAGVWSLVAHATQLIGSVMLSVIVVRMLTVEALGELALGRQMAALLAVVGSLALERTVVRFVPELAECGEPGAARRLVLSLFRIRLLAGAVVAALAILLRGPLAVLVGIQDPGVVVVAGLGAIGFSVAAHLRAAANGWFESRRVAQAAVLTAVLTLVATVLALRSGYGVLTILGIAALAMLVGAAWMWPAAMGPGGSVGAVTERSRLVKYTVPFAIIVLMNQLVHSQTEVFFLGRLRGPEDAAYFQYGFVLAQRLIDFLPLALWEVSMAAFAREDTAGDRDLREVAYRYLRLTYVAILPVSAIGVVLSPALIDLLYGPKMEASVFVAQAYFLLGALAAFGAPMGMILYAREATGLVLRVYLVGTVLNLGLDWWLVSEFGLSGAVAGLAVAKLFLVVGMSVLAARRIGGLSVPTGTILRAFVASAAVLLWWLVNPGLDGLWGVLGGLVFSGLVVIALYRLFRVVAPEDGRLLASTGVPGGGLVARMVTGGTR